MQNGCEYNQIRLSSDPAHLAVDAPVIVLYFVNCVRFRVHETANYFHGLDPEAEDLEHR
jgi:hypothetical protein